MTADRETDVAALRGLLAAGTPGPWRAKGPEVVSDLPQPYCEWLIRLPHPAARDHPRSADDAALIAAAVNTLPSLLDRVEAAEGERDRLRAVRLLVWATDVRGSRPAWAGRWSVVNAREGLVGVLGDHLPRDRYGRCDDNDGRSVGTYCTCGGWEGDYFADGEAGPFDAHLADAIITEWLPGALADEAVGEINRRINRRIYRHEVETPMRGHDEDGACCLRARLTPIEREAT